MSEIGNQDTLGYEDDLAMHKVAVNAARFNEAKQHMLSAINLMAVDGEDQRMAVEMLRNMEQAAKGPDEIMVALANYLRDICSQ